MTDIYTIPSIDGPLASTNIGTGRRRPSTENLLSLLHAPEEIKSLKSAWGRASTQSSWLNSFVSGTWVFLAPLTSVTAFITLYHYDGSIVSFCNSVAEEGLFKVVSAFGPELSIKGTAAWLGWILFQGALYVYLPGPTRAGQPTPAGNVLSYRINGLNAWITTVCTMSILSWLGVIDPAFIPKNWSGLVAAMNITGFCLSIFAMMKAYMYPTHPNDRKFSGCLLFDFYMGIEMNPRLGPNFDLKLFNNGRPGIIAWSLIDLSNMAYQYEKFQSISPSLVLVTMFHGLYIIDFFLNESWYLRTIDIAHDHFGFYLAWGCFAWLPTMYTLQAQYLGQQHPSTSPGTVYLGVWSIIGLLGYALFRSANAQKDMARSAKGKCTIWGRPAQYIRVHYHTLDGKRHDTILLCSGWWGYVRHANYVGDLILSTATCAFAGVLNPLVWFYALYMTILLVHRCLRDEQRGKVKYGKTWDEYCNRVPWRLVPGLW